MKVRLHDSRGMYFVSTFDGVTWQTFSFLDPESQRNFYVALMNSADNYEDVDDERL